MNILDCYDLIVRKALEDLGPIELPASRSLALETQARLAPDLGDALYRLCLEFGVEFAPFRETLISFLACQESAVVSAAGASQPHAFAQGIEPAHPLILLALEMMPGEAFDHRP